jgi:exonuclease VII large subunit
MGDNLAVMTINSNIHQLSSPNRGQDTDRKLNDEEADVCAGTPSQWQEAESAEQ